MVNPSPTAVSTSSPGGSGFTMEQSAMETLQQQAATLRTGYQEAASKLSGQSLAGDAFGTVGAFAAEAFNASTGRSVEAAGKAASTLELVGAALKATAQTQQEADLAGGDLFTGIDTTQPDMTPAGAGGTPTPQGPPVTSPGEIPGGAGNGAGGPFPTGGPQGTPTGEIPRPDNTTQASKATGSEAFTAQGGAPTPQGAGAPAGQAGAIPAGQMPPTPVMSGMPGTSTAPGGGSPEEARTAAARTSATPAPTTAPPTPAMPAFPEVPDPPPLPDDSTSGGGTNVADALENTPATGGTGAGPAQGSSSGTTPPPGGATSSAGATPPPMPPIPEVPEDLFAQPGISDLVTGGGPAGSPGGSDTPGLRPGEQSPGNQGDHDNRGPSDRERTGRDGEARDHHSGDLRPGNHEDQDRKVRDHEDRDRDGEHGNERDGEHGGDSEHNEGEHGNERDGEHGGDSEHNEGERGDELGGERDGEGREGERDGRSERDQHGFPITSVDGKPCLDLRDLPAEVGERWQERIRDILATKGEGSFFWAGDTIDGQGRRHSFMDLAEFMANLDGRGEPGSATEAAGRPVREVSDTVTAGPARSANGDVYVLVGPNHAEGDPVELADFPMLQANPRVERVFAVDAVTGKETRIHPKVS